VWVVQAGLGTQGVAVEAERAITHIRPSVALFVGVAGGLKDVALGDVVAATKVYGYESGRQGTHFLPRPGVYNSSHALQQRAGVESARDDWLKRIPKAFTSTVTPRAFVAPIVAGEKVLAAKRSHLFKFIRSQYSDALAIEMEGLGFHAALHANPTVDALIVRGISDLIARKRATDATGFQRLAATNACAFAFTILARFQPTAHLAPVFQTDQPPTTPSPPPVPSNNPIVDLDGDEMSRVLSALVKTHLIEPFVSIKFERFDLSLAERDRTGDAITFEALNAIRRWGVAFKCPTITPDAAHVQKYGPGKAWASPNATIRSQLSGTLFRTPILLRTIPSRVRAWTRPITVARHAYGDMYKSAEMKIPGPGRVEMTFHPASGADPQSMLVHEFSSPGIALGMHNLDSSIRAFARSCIRYAIATKMEVWFSSKDTVSKTYHSTFKTWFREEVESHKAELDCAGVGYKFLLIDDAVERILRHPGGILLACMNYEGELFSHLVSAGFSSPGLVRSVLVSPEGHFEFDPGHGTISGHYQRYVRGEATSTNPTGTIFAWAGALARRGELDGVSSLVQFAAELERVTVETIESGTMTKDLMAVSEPRLERFVSTEAFIAAVADRLKSVIVRAPG
jgi:isocitrate dehydrogenase